MKNSKTIKVWVEYGMKDNNKVIDFNDDIVSDYIISAVNRNVKNFNDSIRYQFQTIALVEFKQYHLFDLLYSIGINDPCAELSWDIEDQCSAPFLSANLELRRYLLEKGLKICKESEYGILPHDVVIPEEEMDKLISHNGEDFLETCAYHSISDINAMANLTGITDAIVGIEKAAYVLKTNKDNKYIDIFSIREGDVGSNELDDLFCYDSDICMTKHHVILNDENVRCYHACDVYTYDAGEYRKIPEFFSPYAWFKSKLGNITYVADEYEVNIDDGNLIDDLYAICNNPYEIEIAPEDYTDAMELCNTIIDKMLDSESYNILQFPPIGPKEQCTITIDKDVYSDDKVVAVKEISILNEKKSAVLKVYPTYYEYTLNGKVFDRKTYKEGGYAVLNTLLETFKDCDLVPWQEILEDLNC